MGNTEFINLLKNPKYPAIFEGLARWVCTSVAAESKMAAIFIPMSDGSGRAIEV